MSKVYFKRVESKDYSQLAQAARELFETVIKEEEVSLRKDIPIKVHFGEKGNSTYVPQECYDGVIDYLMENDIASSYIETNVLYRGQRTTSQNHIKVALEHGFDRLPIIIADGEIGDEYNDIEINKEFFTHCKIGKRFGDYDQFVVMSHFKGHGMAGFGGAVKQLSMGFASRGGKLAQHSGIKPVVSENSCISCGMCIKKCDYDAIEMNTQEKAFIIHDKCVGCAGCIAVCPVGAIRNDWSGRNFKEKVAEYAYAAQKGKENIYLTFLINVTAECDCNGVHMDFVAKDIGVFAGVDPVAMDTACIDMLQKESKRDLFDSGRVSLRHAEKIGFGTLSYELVMLP